MHRMHTRRKNLPGKSTIGPWEIFGRYELIVSINLRSSRYLNNARKYICGRTRCQNLGRGIFIDPWGLILTWSWTVRYALNNESYQKKSRSKSRFIVFEARRQDTPCPLVCWALVTS
jgi:hypothetical protein